MEEANVRYKEQLAGRDASEAYVEGTSQTLNAMMKNKEVQESAPKSATAKTAMPTRPPTRDPSSGTKLR